MLLDCDNGRLAIIGLTGNLYGGLLAEQAKNLASRRRFVVNDQDAELRRRTHWESWGMRIADGRHRDAPGGREYSKALALGRTPPNDRFRRNRSRCQRPAGSGCRFRDELR